MKRFDSLGQTLIEALVALGVGIAIISAMAVVVVTSLNNAQFSKDQNYATQYAQQGMEVLRRIRDTNWTTFTEYTSTFYCLDKDSAVLRMMSSDCGQNFDNFKREVSISHNSDDCDNTATPSSKGSKVTISVKWSDGRCSSSGAENFCHKADLSSCFYNINTIPTP